MPDPTAQNAPAGCCDMHGPNCEPPSELCCDQCSEARHPFHPEGVACTWASDADVAFGQAVQRLAGNAPEQATPRAAGAPEPPADAAPTTAAPGTSGGSTAILGRALLDTEGELYRWLGDDRWQDLAGAEYRRAELDASEYGPVREVLLVDPTFAQVWAAARAWREASKRQGVYAEHVRVLAAAVDAAEAGGRLSYTNSDIWGPEPVEVLEDVLCRRVWAAALRWEVDRIVADGGDDAGYFAACLRIDADRIEWGALTPWADQPDGPCGAWEPELGPCIAERPCSVHDQPDEAPPERCTALTRHTDINGDDMVPCDNPLPCSWHPAEIATPPPEAEAEMDSNIAEFAALPDCHHCDGTGKQVPDGWYERRRAAERHAAEVLGPAVERYLRSTEAAPEPAGDGPGWERETVDAFIGELEPESQRQITALLAHFDRMNGLTDRQLKQAEGYVRRAEDRAERERDVARADVIQFSARLGFGDDVTEPAASLADMIEPIVDAMAAATDHDDCPVHCELCGETLAATVCQRCKGFGDVGMLAYSECPECGGVGRIHEGCAEASYADLVEQRDAARAELEAAQTVLAQAVRVEKMLESERDAARAELAEVTADWDNARTLFQQLQADREQMIADRDYLRKRLGQEGGGDE